MLRSTHTSTVTEDQIDHLGHMNVRFYAVNAHAGTRALLADLPGWGGRPHVLHDIYTRHHREQLLGTRLEVRSAVLSAGPDGLGLHHELVASDTGVLAATFVHRLRPLDASGEVEAVPDDVVAAALAQAIEAPPYAAPRTVSLDADLLTTTPSLELVLERGLAMRKERRVAAEECDEQGRYPVDQAAMLTWGGQSVPTDTEEMLLLTDDGRRMGWASMETRIQIRALPRPGDRIQSFGAAVALHDKVTHHVHWVFDLASQEVLTAFEMVGLAFDIDGRRPMQIPEAYRRRVQARLQPDLAPQTRV